MKYKAFLNLKQTVNVKGDIRRPAVETGECSDRQKVLDFCKLLLAQGIVTGYRLAYLPEGGTGTWYFDPEVVYDPADLPHIIFPNNW